jgi:aminopeptidase N
MSFAQNKIPERRKLLFMRVLLILLLLQNYAYAQHACFEGKIKQFLSVEVNATAEQTAQMEKYDMRFVHLQLEIDTASTYLQGTAQTTIQIKQVLDTIFIELHDTLIVDSITGVDISTYFRNGHLINIKPKRQLQPDEQITFVIYYHGTPTKGAKSAAGVAGFNNRASPTYGNRITWSLSQPYSAYEWWPCKQSLQDKLDSVWVTIITSTPNTGASHGKLINTENLPGGKVRYHWRSSYPIAYYLVSVAVGNYRQYNQYAKPAGRSDSLFIQNFIYSNPAAFNNNKDIIFSTGPMLEAFSAKFGLYPFYKEKYGHAMAPFSGGMEHQTLTTQGIFNFDIVAHELGHQWFGDAVTCSNWQDIWLNEGFASYCEYLAYEFLKPSQAAQIMSNIHTNSRYNTQLSLWVDDTTDVERIFDYRTTYRKGAAVLHTLRYLLQNDSLFFNLLTTYINRFKYGTANTMQFKALTEELSGKDFTYFFNQWYYAKGIPIFTLKWNQIGNSFFLESKQKNSSNSDTTLFTLPVPYRLYFVGGGDTTIYLNHFKRIENYKVNVVRAISNIALDPDNWILKWVDSLNKETGWVGQKENPASPNPTIFPNPAQTNLQLDGLPKYRWQIRILDYLGREVKSELLLNNRIDIAPLKAGQYLIELYTEEKSPMYLLKFIKQP